MDALRILICSGLLVSFALGSSLKSQMLVNAPYSGKFNRAPTCSVPTSLTAAEKIQVSSTHNSLRDKETEAGNMAHVVFDEELAGVAQEWVNQCIWDHGMMEDCNGARTGQNLHIFYTSSNPNPPADVSRSLQSWYDEKPDYNYDTATCAPGKVCGHYTQVVWDNSFRVGCGYKVCPEIDVGGSIWNNAGLFACNYFPPGNYRGEQPYVKGAKCSDCAGLLSGYASGWKCNASQRCEACNPSDSDCTPI